MRVLVTGGGGFLGAWIAHALIGSGHAVRILDRDTRPGLVNSVVGSGAEAIDWRAGDIADAASVLEAARGCDGIVHLAGLLTLACRADPVRGAMVNLIGTLNVFQAAQTLGIARIVYASSAAVFAPDHARFPEPDTHYGAFKLACEGSARAYWRDAGLASVGFRPYVVYGAGRNDGLTAGPSLACRASVRGEAYDIPYSGAAGLVYVEDVAAAFLAALLRMPDGAHAFNLPGALATSEAVAAEVKAAVPGARIGVSGEPLPFVADIGAGNLDAVLPDLPRTTLRDGIRRTIADYRRIGG